MNLYSSSLAECAKRKLAFFLSLSARGNTYPGKTFSYDRPTERAIIMVFFTYVQATTASPTNIIPLRVELREMKRGGGGGKGEDF